MDTPQVQRHPHTGKLGLGTYGLHPIQCRYCKSGIGFVATTATGSPMPLDWWENPAGNVRIVDVDGQPRALVVAQFELFPPDPDTRWMPHFNPASCPDYDKARRR
jgi:hypothetical protein